MSRRTLHRRPTPRRIVVACSLLYFFAGCRTDAQIHAWRPARITPLSPARVVLAGIRGPRSITQPLTEELLAGARLESPAVSSSVGPPITLLTAESLQEAAPIRLVSGFEQSPSDIAMAAAARSQGVDYLLSGEAIQSTGRSDQDERLSVSWRLTGLSPDAVSGGLPVRVDQEFVQAKYPRLQEIADPAARLREALVIETLGLMTPTVERLQVTLAEPRLLPGSKSVRLGNQQAIAGDWSTAEQTYLTVIEKHPKQSAAWINAAIAAAARQDFVTAKQRVRNAIDYANVSPANQALAQETLVWIEMRQLNLHQAFGLPDPAEGWSILRLPPSH